MDAAAERAFDEAAFESSKVLWPGRVRIGQQVIAASVVVTTGGEMRIDEGGLMAVEELAIEIGRCGQDLWLRSGQMVEHVETGKRYEIYRVLEEPSRWLVRAAMFPER